MLHSVMLKSSENILVQIPFLFPSTIFIGDDELFPKNDTEKAFA
jgi:hypothetical protein